MDGNSYLPSIKIYQPSWYLSAQMDTKYLLRGRNYAHGATAPFVSKILSHKMQKKFYQSRKVQLVFLHWTRQLKLLATQYSMMANW